LFIERGQRYEAERSAFTVGDSGEPGHFVLKTVVVMSARTVGNILDNPTFAFNLIKMAEKEANDRGNTAEFDINSDENMAGTSHLNDPMEQDSEQDKLKAELADAKDKYLRLVAEFDNFRRRTAKERIELMQTAGRDVIKDVLDVLDDADRAQKQLDGTDDIKQIREGVTLVFNKLRNEMLSKGLKPMDAIGKNFDPDLHEAITEIPAPSDDMVGKVIDEVVKGYYLNDKIIRHAKVVVGK
jgi:molecular chaperone GrpE